jgi:hypothetical protein
MVVVIVEAALPNGDGTERNFGADGGGIARRVEVGGVVRVDAGGEEDEARDSPIATIAAAPSALARAIISSRSASKAGSARWACESMNRIVGKLSGEIGEWRTCNCGLGLHGSQDASGVFRNGDRHEATSDRLITHKDNQGEQLSW